MNRNKKHLLAFVFYCLAVCLVLGWILSAYIPTPSGDGMSADSITTYSLIIENENVTNWHSSLFMHECIALKHITYWLTGQLLSGTAVLFGAWVIMTTMMVIAIITLGYSLIRSNLWWFIALPCCIILSFIHVRYLYPIGLDYYFTCILWCLLAAMVVHFRASSHTSRIVCTCIIIFFLFHLVSYRKNSILFIPFVLGWLLYMTCWFRKICITKKLTVWISVSLIFTLISYSGVDILLPVTKQHPITPMMESDVRIAAILRGEQDAFRREGILQSTGSITEDCISAYWIYLPEKSWDKILTMYINEWKEHPETMIAASIIQRIQFYSGGHNLPFLRKWVESRYPVVKKNENTWKIITPLYSPQSYVPHLKGLLMMCTAPISIVLASLLLHRKTIAPEASSTCIIAGSLSFLYAISYLIVTPTSDARYLAPAEMFAILSFALSAISVTAMLCRKYTPIL